MSTRAKPPDRLIDYFALIERRGFELTVNDFSGLIVSNDMQAMRFAPYLIHRNVFCMKVKTESRLWSECLRRKTTFCAAAAARADCFLGACFCGREEYVMPVMKDGIVLATIAIGGFAADRDRDLRRASRVFASAAAVSAAAAAAAFDAAVRVEPPTIEDARGLLGLAAEEMARLYERLEIETGSLVVPEAARLSRERRLCLHAAEYLRRRMQDSVGVKEVASACHVSVSSLSHTFKRTMGLSLRAYLLRLRLEKAKDLLEAGSTVTEAALQSGFDDPNYFSRAFSVAKGVPPSKWRS